MKKLKVRVRFSRRVIVLIACAATVSVGAAAYLLITHHNSQIARQEAELRLQEHVRQEANKMAELEEQKKISEAKDSETSLQSNDTQNPTTNSTKKAARPTSTSKPGDLIGNNTTKSAKTYYGGPLVFSPSTVTVSLSSVRPKVTVTGYDGAAISMPTSYWDTNPQVFVGVDSNLGLDTDNARSSWPMIVDARYDLAPGTYTAEVVAHTHNDIDTVEYSGHLTVIVTPN